MIPSSMPTWAVWFAVTSLFVTRLAGACTTIVVGRNASADGSTMCTHNVDCLDCDFRLGRVPARDWPAGSMRPVTKFRAEYPRTVTEDRGMTWTPENLDSELEQHGVWLEDSWRESMVLGHIPQVNHTFAYLEGSYGIINEKQVGIGESTCGAKWFAGPVSDDCDRCNALFDVSELTRIALERASTAREAVQIMGDLAVEHGFYGSEWDENDKMTFEEAGEALTVTDPNEAWVFHILSDDTSTSAVWAAQRVPDNHISVVANQFTIEEVRPDADPDWFMFSENLFMVAERGGCGYKRGSGFPLHFSKAFTVRPDDFPHYVYTTRRVWRVFDIFAPSLGLSPYTDPLATDYPFSVRPDGPVSTQDVIKVLRDHYEGTSFDMTKGMASGPYGDPDRYDVAPSLDGSTTEEDTHKGFFERSISLFRTSYSFVTQSRQSLPNEVGALVWIAQYKPSVSTYIPIYVTIEEVPCPYTVGSLFRFLPESSYWSFSVVGNWMSRYRKFAHADVMAVQSSLEEALFMKQSNLEKEASALALAGNLSGVSLVLTSHVNASAISAVSAYHDLFIKLVARYHDGYQMQDPATEIIKMNKLYYPKYWLEGVGFFHSLQDDQKALDASKGPSRTSGGDSRGVGGKSETASGGRHGKEPVPNTESPLSSSAMKTKTTAHDVKAVLTALVFALILFLVGLAIGRCSVKKAGYVSVDA